MEITIDQENIITKEFLKQYSLLLEEITGEQERLIMMMSKMTSISSKSNDGMPQGSIEPDRIGLKVSIKADLEERIKELISEEQSRRNMIEENLIKKVDFPRERQVIRLKYIDRLSWTEVQSKLFGSRKDYYKNEDKYRRLVYRIHGNALSKLSKQE